MVQIWCNSTAHEAPNSVTLTQRETRPMATIVQRTSKNGQTSCRAQGRRKGAPPLSATFAKLSDARKWVQTTEAAIIELPFYQFTQPFVAASPCSGNSLDFFDSFSVRCLRGQGSQNATHGDQDSSPGDPPNAQAGDPTDPSPAARRPLQWLSTATQLTRPN